MSGYENQYGMGTSANPLSPGTHEVPNALARIGRGMADITEPIYSYLLAHPAPEARVDPSDPTYADARKQYDARREAEEALYLRGLLGTSVPEQLRGAVPDIWRAVGQAAPFFALGPLGGLPSLTGRGVASAAANTLGYSAIGQPAMYAPELMDWRTRRRLGLLDSVASK